MCRLCSQFYRLLKRLKRYLKLTKVYCINTAYCASHLRIKDWLTFLTPTPSRSKPLIVSGNLTPVDFSTLDTAPIIVIAHKRIITYSIGRDEEESSMIDEKVSWILSQCNGLANVETVVLKRLRNLNAIQIIFKSTTFTRKFKVHIPVYVNLL